MLIRTKSSEYSKFSFIILRREKTNFACNVIRYSFSNIAICVRLYRLFTNLTMKLIIIKQYKFSHRAIISNINRKLSLSLVIIIVRT